MVGTRNLYKLIGISVTACCAVLVCTMFANFYIDIRLIKGSLSSLSAISFYDAQVSTAKIVCLVTGGCLLITSVIMLIFYIKHYIDTHRKELGILKALGYSNLKIARGFWVFGMSAFTGTAAGFGGAFLIMPRFYALQNEGNLLPEISIGFHPSLLFYFVILPTVGFSLLAVGYAWLKLKTPVLSLLKNGPHTVKKHKNIAQSDLSFTEACKKSILRSRKALVFFIMFASFCFSAMTQMSFSMKDLSSEMMGAMMLVIGTVLSVTTMLLAVTAVIRGNTKTIAMMRVFGYSQKECRRTLLGGYRPISYLGFALGTAYQYALLRLMVDIVFGDIGDIPVYEFDLTAMLVSLAVFIIIYELFMFACSEKIKKISVKEIMLE